MAQQLRSASIAWIMEVRRKNSAITFPFFLAHHVNDGTDVWSFMGPDNVVFQLERYGNATFVGNITESPGWHSVWRDDGSVSRMA